ARDLKKFVHELQIVCSMTACTCLLLSSTERPRPFRPEHTMGDGIIERGDEIKSLRTVRSLAVHKMRGTAPVLGRHTVEINDAGLRALPRFETRVTARSAEQHARSNDRLALGVPELDRMLGG